MIRKIDHIVITTAQPEACVDFYEQLGFQSVDAGGRYELYAGDFKINVHIKGKELLPRAAHVQTGSADFCFEIDGNLELLRTEFIEKGLSIELGIVDRTGVKGAMKSFYMRDPDENLLEFCSYH